MFQCIIALSCWLILVFYVWVSWFRWSHGDGDQMLVVSTPSLSLANWCPLWSKAHLSFSHDLSLWLCLFHNNIMFCLKLNPNFVISTLFFNLLVVAFLLFNKICLFSTLFLSWPCFWTFNSCQLLPFFFNSYVNDHIFFELEEFNIAHDAYPFSKLHTLRPYVNVTFGVVSKLHALNLTILHVFFFPVATTNLLFFFI